MTVRELGTVLLYPYAVQPAAVERSRTKATRRRARRSPRPSPDVFFTTRADFEPPGVGRFLR